MWVCIDVPTGANMSGDAATPSGKLGEDVVNVPPAKRPVRVERIALIAGMIAVAVLTGLIGWLTFRAYEADSIQAQRNLFVQAASQGAANLSTVDYEHADADAQRILDSATGKFYDSFSHRRQSYIENAKRTRSKSVGTVTDAGLQSQTGDLGRVLVAVTVRSPDPAQEPQFWRMQITVQKMGDVAKLSDVVFVS
jgi:Mce-associated membrane protein